MEVLTGEFREETIRYALISDNGILFNTSDVCRALHINEQSLNGIFSKECLNIAGIIEIAHLKDRINYSFIDWIETEFFGYDIFTPVDSNCGNWKSD